MSDSILELALQGEKDVEDGKWTIPAEAKDAPCEPLQRCHYCCRPEWTLWWVYRKEVFMAFCGECRGRDNLSAWVIRQIKLNYPQP